MITIGVRQLVLSSSLQKLPWGIVQLTGILTNPGDGSSNGLAALSLTSLYFFPGLCQHQGLEFTFDSHVSPFDVGAKMVDAGLSFFFSQAFTS